jgi:Holliday junction resolvase RusA-like endonuclease
MAGQLQLHIPGEPVAKKRPRFARRGKFVMTYNDQETEEGKFIAQVLFQINGHEPFQGPLSVDVGFYVGRPKAHYGTGKNEGVLKPSAPKHCLNVKDVDNYLKFAFDCLNEVAWKDDRQVVMVQAGKWYADDLPRTEITIIELD